jgi:inosine-uridine nucleoside N-ribohydrolase
MPTPVIIDCDPGHDDAMALLLALASPELELVAVTTVAGNASLPKVTENAIKVLDVAGAGHVLPPPSRQPEPVHAVELIASKLRERPLTLIPTAPLTNIALLLALHPELHERIERIVLMGGAVGLGNVTPSAEFNIWCDPEAAYRVFTSGIDVTLVGLDVTHRAMLSAARAEQLRDKGRAAAVVADLHAFYRRFHEQVYGHDDTPVHDALAVAHVIDPTLLRTEDLYVEIDVTQGPARGRTVVDQLKRLGRPANAHVALDVNATGFIDLLTERIGSLP